jgi:hypothetical protein
MQRKSHPIDWRLRGASDALDASMAFKGAMSSLQNLIPDPSTTGIFQCRPASMQLVNFNTSGGPFSSGFSSGFQAGYASPSTLGSISVMRISGNIVYGMIGQTTGALAGYDIPFAFNLSSNTLIAVTGTQTTTTLPQSQPTAGVWIPPSMALIGVKMMVAHAGFTGAGGNYVGWMDLTTPSAPVWNAGNLTGGFISFTVAPTAVVQFFNRAYYIHNAINAPAVIFSDALAATNCTNANQILTFGDNTPLTALGALPLSTQLGGIIQSVMVFKGVANIYQISGDAGLNNLYVNALNMATGTLAPNSLANTPKGLVFMAPDGMRLIDFSGTVQDPIGLSGTGITVPFIFANVPSRVNASSNGNLLRVFTQNNALSTQPNQDWWYDFGRQIWTGPHTFPAALAQPYKSTFIIVPVGTTATLWQSDFFQNSGSQFIENGTAMQWVAASCLLPDTDQITNNAITEGSIDMALPSTSAPVNVNFVNQNGSSINTVVINPIGSATPAIWGTMVWGAFTWGGGAAAALAPYQLDWSTVIVFARGAIQATGFSVLGFKISTIHLRYQVLKAYVNMFQAA